LTSADLCEVDHATEWTDGGRTDQRNGGGRCGGHNRDKHRRRWQVRRAANGRNYTVRNDGTLMLPVGCRVPTFPPTNDDDDDDVVEIPMFRTHIDLIT
jgi:hypothetical protein